MNRRAIAVQGVGYDNRTFALLGFSLTAAQRLEKYISAVFRIKDKSIIFKAIDRLTVYREPNRTEIER